MILVVVLQSVSSKGAVRHMLYIIDVFSFLKYNLFCLVSIRLSGRIRSNCPKRDKSDVHLPTPKMIRLFFSRIDAP